MRRAVLIALVAAGALVAGCSGDSDAADSSPSVPSFSSSTTTPAPTTTTGPSLPADCRSVLPTAQLDLVLGKPLVGKTSSIVGVAEPKIRRLERLTCRYGLPDKPKKDEPIPLEVSVSQYADEASATERVDITIESQRANGAAPSTVQVGPVEGTVLVTKDERLLVAVDGTLTVAVSVGPKVVADNKVADVLAELGGRVFAALAT